MNLVSDKNLPNFEYIIQKEFNQTRSTVFIIFPCVLIHNFSISEYISKCSKTVTKVSKIKAC